MFLGVWVGKVGGSRGNREVKEIREVRESDSIMALPNFSKLLNLPKLSKLLNLPNLPHLPYFSTTHSPAPQNKQLGRGASPIRAASNTATETSPLFGRVNEVLQRLHDITRVKHHGLCLGKNIEEEHVRRR